VSNHLLSLESATKRNECWNRSGGQSNLLKTKFRWNSFLFVAGTWHVPQDIKGFDLLEVFCPAPIRPQGVIAWT